MVIHTMPLFDAHCAAGRRRRELAGLKSGAQLIVESELAAARATRRCAALLVILGFVVWYVLH